MHACCAANKELRFVSYYAVNLANYIQISMRARADKAWQVNCTVDYLHSDSDIISTPLYYPSLEKVSGAVGPLFCSGEAGQRPYISGMD
jgi:hypothetical protein